MREKDDYTFARGMKRKKDTPLDVWRALEEYSQKPSPLYRRVENHDTYLRLEDSDPDSAFYFSIVGYSHPQGQLHLRVRYSPSSSANIEPQEHLVPASALKQHFAKWLSILEGYQTVQTPFDDPILKQYRDEFDVFFEVKDDDATTHSFDWEKQQRIDAMLGAFIALAEASQASGELDEADAAELLNDASQLRKEQSKSTKAEVAKRIGELVTKARKASVKFAGDVIRGILTKTLSELLSGKLPELLN